MDGERGSVHRKRACVYMRVTPLAQCARPGTVFSSTRHTTPVATMRARDECCLELSAQLREPVTLAGGVHRRYAYTE